MCPQATYLLPQETALEKIAETLALPEDAEDQEAATPSAGHRSASRPSPPARTPSAPPADDHNPDEVCSDFCRYVKEQEDSAIRDLFLMIWQPWTGFPLNVCPASALCSMLFIACLLPFPLELPPHRLRCPVR